MPDKKIPPHLFLYESRLLFRSAARRCLHEKNYVITDIGAELLRTQIHTSKQDLTIFAAGLGGAGEDMSSVLQAIYSVSSLKNDIVVWLPECSAVLMKFMLGLGVNHVLYEDRLYTELQLFDPTFPFISPYFLREKSAAESIRWIKKLSPAELATVLDFSRGLDVRAISAFRQISDKTVYTHRKNAMKNLKIESATEWFKLLTFLKGFDFTR